MAKKTGILKVRAGTSGDWTILPDPAKMSVSIYDLDYEDGAGRNQKGYMFRDRVAVKRKLVIEFPPMYKADVVDILGSAITNVFFYCKYPDPLTGDEREMQCYVGDRTMDFYNINGMYQSNWIYEGITMDFIER